jgi:hypothetical protein
MNPAQFPVFEPEHFYSEQVIVLRSPVGIYGKIIAHYPTDMEGGPDMTGPRPPIFTGQLQLVGQLANGSSVNIPLEFQIPTNNPIEAVMLFRDCALKAIEEYQSQAFRKNLVVPGVLKQ